MTADDDVALVHAVALAVLDLDEADPATGFATPYPDRAQSALDQLTLTCLSRGALPPRSLPGLVGWCGSRPLADWPLRLPDEVLGGDGLLVDVRRSRPTGLCREWAEDSGAVRSDPVRDHLSVTAEPDRHLECRLFLAEHQVVPDDVVTELAGDRATRRTWRLVRGLYGPVPRALVRRGEVARCTACHALSVPLPGGGWVCERETCAAADQPPELLPATGSLVLAEAARRTIGGVGRVEQAVAKLARNHDAAVTCEAEGLRIDWPEGGHRLVLTFDHGDPALLARAVNRSAWRDRSPLVVVPGERLWSRSGYRVMFSSLLPGAPTLVADSELVDLVGGSAKRNEA
ncbi:hypothetical protein AB0A63_17560 [Lentzea sp. NPDC042327]|uniref:pPIWI_RE_Y domain-containing protein n=1 Tax=Lentzea sp. NPDC042327 TaxID=3154801 RepID=UPI0033F7AEB1